MRLGIFLISILALLVASVNAEVVPKTEKRSRLTNDASEIHADRREMLLTAGEDKVVDLEFDANAGANGISIGNPKVVATTLVKIADKRQMVFKPLSAGHTTVTVRDVDGPIRLIFNVVVTDSNMAGSLSDVKELLKDIEGLEFNIRNNKIVIDGEVLVPNDYGRLLSVTQDSAYADLIMNLAILSPVALQIMAKKIQDDINSFAPNVKARLVNGLIWLEGTVDNYSQAKRAARVAELYVPELKPGSQLERDPTIQRLPPRSLIQNFIVINQPPAKKQEKLVRVTVHFVELSKDYNKMFGFKWQPGFTADPQISIGTTEQGEAGASGTSFTGTISSLFPKLQSAQSAGFARILKTGTLIVRSGQSAQLEDKVEIPYVVQSGTEMKTEKAGVGLTVAVTPQILGQSEDIQLDLETNQVNLGPKAGNAPTTASHKVKTKIYVKSSESAAIAGVTSSDIQTNFNKDDPYAGSFSDSTIPLFSLLRSKSYAKKKSQFVIFVTPQIINSASEGTDDLKKNFRVKVR